MTPNEIILALVDVASAAFAVQHGAQEHMQQTHVDGDDLARLRAKLFVLDQLPQPANMPPLTPSAKARYYMQAFLGGAAPVEIDGKQFSAAFWLSGLGETVPPLQPMEPAPRGFGNPSAAEINDITMDTLGKWPSFEAQSWACKVVTAVAEKLRSQDIAAARDKLLADTANEAHRIWNDADLLASLRRLCGYVENGSSESIGISQDDATNEWVLRIGPSMSPRVRHFHARSFHQVIRIAADDMLENERCKFCGFEVEFACDEPPPDICSAAIRAAEKQKRAKPATVTSAAPAGPSREYLAREAMNKLLLELATTYSNSTAKRIIIQVGGAQKMKDIPDDKVQAVTIATRDRLALERRIAELKAAGDTAGLESLLRGTEGKVAGSPETAARQSAIQDNLQRVVGDTREAYGMPILPQYWPSPIQDPMKLAAIDTSADRPVELPQQDEVQGQGGEFDGGGASGDFQ